METVAQSAPLSSLCVRNTEDKNDSILGENVGNYNKQINELQIKFNN